MNGFDLSARLFLQLAVIAAAGRVAAWAGRRLLQPPVVCEMIAGVLLGPSLFGWVAPRLSAAVFPHDSMPILFAVSQLGLALYMFAMGLEFRYDLLAKGWRGSAAVSLAGIAAPMVLGAWLGLRLHGAGGFFAAATSPREAMLFVGAAVSITAFPMLARIIVERGLSGTRVGALAMGAGAFDDVAAWCLLAVLLASFDSNPSLVAVAFGGGAFLIAFLFFAVRPLAAALVRRHQTAALGGAGLSWALIALMLASWFSDSIRLYAVFGAFMLGLVLPRGPFAQRLRDLVEPLTTAILVPVFFAYSGLNTRLDLLNSWPLWAAAGLVLLISTAAKGLACGLTARAVGYSWPDAIAVGTLMNSRGLMELILLNIGLQRGVITPTLFTILVLMASITTVAASPLFELVRPRLSGGRESERPRVAA